MKKWMIFGLSLILCLCTAQAALGEGELFPIREGGLWGYINASGEVVIAPQFAWAGAFRGAGYAAVEAKSTDDDMYACGIIDRAGKYVVEPKYCADEGYDGHYYGGKDTGVIWLMEEESGRLGFFDVVSGCFSGIAFDDASLGAAYGRLLTVRKDDKIGFADRTTGKLAIDYQYLDTDEWSFSNGYAYVEKEDKNGDSIPLMIDETGKQIALPEGFEPAEYTYVEDGLFSVLETDSNLYGYADVNGKIVIEAKYDEVAAFENGYADVVLEGESLVINAKGEIAERPNESSQNGRSLDIGGDIDYPDASVIDANGNAVVPFSAGYQFYVSYSFGYDDFFAEGAQVLVKDGKYGFLNEDGAEVIPFIYDYAENFDNGLAYAERDGYMLYLNHAGEIVWQEK